MQQELKPLDELALIMNGLEAIEDMLCCMPNRRLDQVAANNMCSLLNVVRSAAERQIERARAEPATLSLVGGTSR